MALVLCFLCFQKKLLPLFSKNCFLCFQKKLLPSFWIHWTSFVLNPFCFLCFQKNASFVLNSLNFLCFKSILLPLFWIFKFNNSFTLHLLEWNILLALMERKYLNVRHGAEDFSFYFFLQKMLKSSFEQTKFSHTRWRRLKFRSFWEYFCLLPVWLVSFLFWRSVPFIENFFLDHEICLSSKRTMFRSRQRDLFVLIFPLEGGRFGYWTCSRSLFQVGRFLFVSGAFASPKYDKCYSSWWGWERTLPILASSSWRIFGGFCEILGVLYWRLVVGLDHKFVVGEVHHLLSDGVMR